MAVRSLMMAKEKNEAAHHEETLTIEGELSLKNGVGSFGVLSVTQRGLSQSHLVYSKSSHLLLFILNFRPRRYKLPNINQVSLVPSPCALQLRLPRTGRTGGRRWSSAAVGGRTGVGFGAAGVV